MQENYLLNYFIMVAELWIHLFIPTAKVASISDSHIDCHIHIKFMVDGYKWIGYFMWDKRRKNTFSKTPYRLKPETFFGH